MNWRHRSDSSVYPLHSHPVAARTPSMNALSHGEITPHSPLSGSLLCGRGCTLWRLKVQSPEFWVGISVLPFLGCGLGQFTDPLCLHTLICDMGLGGGLNEFANAED